MGKPRAGLLVMLALSIAIAVAAAWVPWASQPRNPDVRIGFALTALWIVMVVVAFARLRRSALWLLLGAPAAMLWPVLFAWLIVACSAFGQCI